MSLQCPFSCETTWQKLSGNISLLQVGDIVHVKNFGLISQLIRKLTRSKGESPSWASHTAMVIKVAENIEIIEAVNPKITIRPITAYADSKAKLAVFRKPEGLSEQAKEKLKQKALDYYGRRYGIFAIALHALDGVFGGIYFFRRIGRMDKYPICSWVVAYVYDRVLTYSFGLPADAAQPDDILDHCVEKNWRCVWADSEETLKDLCQTYTD